MPFNLVPVEAYRVDISGVEDVQRERLRIVFENGKELFFGLLMKGPIGERAPRLALDYSANNAGAQLQKLLSRRFYTEHVVPTLGLSSKLRGRKSPYRGFTPDMLYDRLEVTFEMGRPGGSGPWYAGHLQVGHLLELRFGTLTSVALYHSLHTWGAVVEIDSHVIPPVSATSPRILPVPVS